MKKRKPIIILLMIAIMVIMPNPASAQENQDTNFFAQLGNVVSNLVLRGVPQEENGAETSELVLSKAFVSDNIEDEHATISGNTLIAQFMTSVPVQINGAPTIDGIPVEYDEQEKNDENGITRYLYTAICDLSNQEHTNGDKIEVWMLHLALCRTQKHPNPKAALCIKETC